MKKPKFNIGDIVNIHSNVHKEKRQYVITRIIIDKDCVYYNTDNTDILISENDLEGVKLPQTYKEAVQPYLEGNEDKLCYFRDKTLQGYDTITATKNPNLFEYKNSNAYSIDRNTCKIFTEFEKLIFLRDIYRQGWKPDWEDDTVKYTISAYCNQLELTSNNNLSSVLSFQTEEIRDMFLNNFRYMIELCKDFI